MNVPMNLEEERQDDEKNRCMNKLLDICLSLTEQVIRLKEMIESSSMERRRAAAMPPAPQYSYTTALMEPFIREIRQRQQQEQEQEEQRIDDVEESDSEEEEEDMIDCDSRRMLRVPPFKRQKLQYIEQSDSTTFSDTREPIRGQGILANQRRGITDQSAPYHESADSVETPIVFFPAHFL